MAVELSHAVGSGDLHRARTPTESETVMVEAWGLVAIFAALLVLVLGTVCVVLWFVVTLVVRAGPAAVRLAGQIALVGVVLVVLVVVLVAFGPADLAQVLEAAAAVLS